MAPRKADPQNDQLAQRFERERENIERRYSAQLNSIESRKKMELERLENRFDIEKKRLQTSKQTAAEAAKSRRKELIKCVFMDTRDN